MSHHIVEVEDLRFSYSDGTAAVRGVSFRIHHGESVAIVGANGAGKSTLLLHLNGYLTPSAGRVRIGDFPLTKETVKEIRRTVLYGFKAGFIPYAKRRKLLLAAKARLRELGLGGQWTQAEEEAMREWQSGGLLS